MSKYGSVKMNKLRNTCLASKSKGDHEDGGVDVESRVKGFKERVSGKGYHSPAALQDPVSLSAYLKEPEQLCREQMRE